MRVVTLHWMRMSAVGYWINIMCPLGCMAGDLFTWTDLDWSIRQRGAHTAVFPKQWVTDPWVVSEFFFM